MECREYRFHSEVEPGNLLQDVLPQHKDYFRLIEKRRDCMAESRRDGTAGE